nr:unnamed protein product [Callosobruchus chinensis]
MRPRLKKCRGAVKRRDVATQTDVFDFWNPRVVLKRVGCPREKSPPREDEEVATDGKSEVSEIVTVQEKPIKINFSENPLETASTPDMLELNLNVSSIGSMIEYNERSTQTQTAGTSQEIDQGGTGEGKSDEPPPVQDEDPPPGPSVIDAELNDEPIRESNAEPIEETRAANTSFRMKMNGVATTITTVPEDGTTPDSSSDESGSDQNNPRESRRTKFLKIRAHTVHIHNHFYGGRK